VAASTFGVSAKTSFDAGESRRKSATKTSGAGTRTLRKERNGRARR